MLVTVSATVTGEQQYVRGFEALANEMRDLREPLARIRDQISIAIREQFDTHGAHGLGGGWQPLNPDYEKWKAVHFPGKPLMERTGALRDDLTDPLRATLELSAHRLVYGVRPDAVNDQGDNVAEYGALAQTGGGDGHHPPQRKLIALTLAERRQFDREFVTWINGRRHALLPG